MTSTQAVLPKVNANFNVGKTIGLISDTHIPQKAVNIPKAVFTAFENVDYILHAGDLVELSVIDELEQIAPVLAVHGNMDTEAVSSILPAINSLKICDKKIGLMHDPGILFGLSNIRSIAKQNGFDIFVYGHTHNASVTWDGKALYINPGSPIDPSNYLNKPSVALLKVSKDTIFPEIINI
jgi:putative phosphoesterase